MNRAFSFQQVASAERGFRSFPLVYLCQETTETDRKTDIQTDKRLRPLSFDLSVMTERERESARERERARDERTGFRPHSLVYLRQGKRERERERERERATGGVDRSPASDKEREREREIEILAAHTNKI